jgi:hypothetical protein
MHLTGIGHENMDWIQLAQENKSVLAVVNTVVSFGFQRRRVGFFFY